MIHSAVFHIIIHDLSDNCTYSKVGVDGDIKREIAVKEINPEVFYVFLFVEIETDL